MIFFNPIFDKRLFFLLCVFSIGLTLEVVEADGSHNAPVDYRVCSGTTRRMTVPSNRTQHYLNMKERYSNNCTHVDGNLELTWIQFDLDFLIHIQEVSGYVLISHVDFPRIVLPNLQIIRGQKLFHLNLNGRNEEFVLLVMLSRMDTLELPALRDVLAGNVGVFNNYNLCHVKTINWDEIISGVNAKYVYVYNFTQAERDCPSCNKACEAGCWGEGEHNCQKFSKINCSPQCYNGRCFGSGPRECCHSSCAGGCAGPLRSDCFTCKKFYDDGKCVDECPPLINCNRNSSQFERVPDGKYFYGAKCVKSCPSPLLNDPESGTCVEGCPLGKEAVDGECPSNLGPCVSSQCHAKCVDGCTGPENTIGPSGCVSCQLAIVVENDRIQQCLGEDEPCPNGYYRESVRPTEQGSLWAMAGKYVCRKCHPRCLKCTAYGYHTQVCQECAFSKRGEQCEGE